MLQTLKSSLKSNVYALFMALGVMAFAGQIYAQSDDVIADFGACLATNPPSQCKDIMPR